MFLSSGACVADQNMWESMYEVTDSHPRITRREFHGGMTEELMCDMWVGDRI